MKYSLPCEWFLRNYLVGRRSSVGISVDRNLEDPPSNEELCVPCQVRDPNRFAKHYQACLPVKKLSTIEIIKVNIIIITTQLLLIN